MQLFTRRAQQMRRQLVLDDDATAAVEEVCRALDGLPLAIELAASRVRSLSVRDIARRLDDRFALLRDPNSQRPERRRALSGAIAWSYELLFPDDQRGLWALSCFAGSASLDATEHVLAALGVPTASVLDTISRLVDRSLVSVDERRRRDGALPTARQHQGVRRRAAAASRARPTRPRPRTPRGTPRLRRLVRRARAQRATAGVPGDRPRRTGQRRRGAGLVRRARSAARRTDRQRVRLDLGGARRRHRRSRARPRRPHCRYACAATARRHSCSPGGSRPRPVTWPSRSETSTVPARSPTSLADDVLVADVERHQAFLVDPAGSTRRGARERRRPAWRRTGRWTWTGGSRPVCCSPRSAR